MSIVKKQVLAPNGEWFYLETSIPVQFWTVGERGEDGEEKPPELVAFQREKMRGDVLYEVLVDPEIEPKIWDADVFWSYYCFWAENKLSAVIVSDKYFRFGGSSGWGLRKKPLGYVQSRDIMIGGKLIDKLTDFITDRQDLFLFQFDRSFKFGEPNPINGVCLRYDPLPKRWEIHLRIGLELVMFVELPPDISVEGKEAKLFYEWHNLCVILVDKDGV